MIKIFVLFIAFYIFSPGCDAIPRNAQFEDEVQNIKEDAVEAAAKMVADWFWHKWFVRTYTKHLDGVKYVLNTKRRTYIKSEQYCRGLGGKIAITHMKTEAERKKVYELFLKERRMIRAWLPVRFSNNEWKYANIEPINTTFGWAEGAPANKGMCATNQWKTSKAVDLGCGNHHEVICEITE